MITKVLGGDGKLGVPRGAIGGAVKVASISGGNWNIGLSLGFFMMLFYRDNYLGRLSLITFSSKR